MRTTVLGLSLVAALAVPAAAAGSTGPYAGHVAEGQTQTHTYDNNPGGYDCIQLAVPYEVTVVWAGPATVTLAASGASTTESDGAATLVVTRGWCTSFDVGVTAVAGDATYVLTVNRQLLPASGLALG